MITKKPLCYSVQIYKCIPGDLCNYESLKSLLCVSAALECVVLTIEHRGRPGESCRGFPEA